MNIDKKRYKAVIFDMDGTIVDTSHIWDKANIIYFDQKGIKNSLLREQVSKELHGLALSKGAIILKEMLGIEDSISQIIKENQEIAYELYKLEITFIEGFIDFHDKLKQLNIPTAIATNADEYGLKRTIECLSLHKHFDVHMYGISCVNNICKPSPHIYLHAAKQLNKTPEECIAIEDSFYGVTAAKNANMYCIAIDTSKIRNQLSHADIIVDQYHEINLEELLYIAQQ